MREAPEVEIELIETGGHPVGLGEPALAVTAPAIANAIFDAVGIRIRNLPIRPKDIKSLMES